MLPGKTGISPALTDAKDDSFNASPGACRGKSSENFEKYEGKTESVVEGNLRSLAGVAVENSCSFNGTSAIIFFSAKVSQNCPHLINNLLSSLPDSGLEIKNRLKLRQEKI
jgi:hypothetical protein